MWLIMGLYEISSLGALDTEEVISAREMEERERENKEREPERVSGKNYITLQCIKYTHT
jgi:hypothetical protein